jgi:hypothetical protein
MTQKYLYLIDFNQPFPASEYGGLIAAIASSDTECHTILLEEELWNEKHSSLIMQAVIKAQKFKLVDDYESDIIEAFTT